MTLNKEENTVEINCESYEIEKYNNFFYFETDLKKLTALKLNSKDIDHNLIIRIQSSDGFGSHLFYEAEIFRNDDDTTQLVFICHQPNKFWEGKYGLSTFITEIIEHAEYNQLLSVERETLEIEDDWKRLELFTSVEEDFKLTEILNKYSDILKKIIKQAELSLSGSHWKKEYETNESLFSEDILYPLFRKMDYLDVRYTHGTKEYGKDFTFSQLSSFGNLIHYGVQVKAGDMRGNVKSDIDEILGQIEDAFAMPYYEVCANEKRRINTFIIAISGKFTDNAKEKIANKINPILSGSVYMLDREKILELIERFWK